MHKTDNQPQHITIKGDGKNTALEVMHKQTGLNKSELKLYAQCGAVWVSNVEKNLAKSKPERLRRLKKTLKNSQVIDFYLNPELLRQIPPKPKLIEDEKQYSVWIKPRGMLSQGSKWADHTALYRWVEMNYLDEGNSRQSWIVHRLDRATHGLMILAHSKKMSAVFSRMFEENNVKKTYKALVWGEFPSNLQTYQQPIDDKAATSHISLVKTIENSTSPVSLVEVEIETGRKHQIRKHLSENGFPILGDRLYGDSDKDFLLETRPDLQLTAYKLSFECPLNHQQKNYQLKDDELDLISELRFKME